MPHVIIFHFRVFTFYRSVASKVRLSACLALFPQEGALWMSTGSSRWPETGGRCFTPFQWEILFSKKRPTSPQQVGEGERETSVAHHWRFQPHVERRPEKKKKRGQRSNVHCGGNGALFWLTRESSRQETDRIQTNPERKRRRGKKNPNNKRLDSRCRWQRLSIPEVSPSHLQQHLAASTSTSTSSTSTTSTSSTSTSTSSSMSLESYSALDESSLRALVSQWTGSSGDTRCFMPSMNRLNLRDKSPGWRSAPTLVQLIN